MAQKTKITEVDLQKPIILEIYKYKNTVYATKLPIEKYIK